MSATYTNTVCTGAALSADEGLIEAARARARTERTTLNEAFVNTNVLIYQLEGLDARKAEIADELSFEAPANSRSMGRGSKIRFADSGYKSRIHGFTVAEPIFRGSAAHRLFLEYDDERSSGFAPLASVPDDKIVVLGNYLTSDAQAAKLRLVAEVAERISGGRRAIIGVKADLR